MSQQYPKPPLANGEAVSTARESLEVIRYLTGEWLADPGTFGQWAGGCYMEKLHELAASGLRLLAEQAAAPLPTLREQLRATWSREIDRIEADGFVDPPPAA